MTGVQTCALPIFPQGDGSGRIFLQALQEMSRESNTEYMPLFQTYMRSEESRVGKECRSGGWRYEEKKKSRRIIGEEGDKCRRLLTME